MVCRCVPLSWERVCLFEHKKQHHIMKIQERARKKTTPRQQTKQKRELLRKPERLAGWLSFQHGQRAHTWCRRGSATRSRVRERTRGSCSPPFLQTKKRRHCCAKTPTFNHKPHSLSLISPLSRIGSTNPAAWPSRAAPRALSQRPGSAWSCSILVSGTSKLGDTIRRRQDGGDGDKNLAFRAEKTRRSRAIGGKKQKKADEGRRASFPSLLSFSPNTNVARFPAPLALFSLSPSTMLSALMTQMVPAVELYASPRLAPSLPSLPACTWHPVHVRASYTTAWQRAETERSMIVTQCARSLFSSTSSPVG